MDALAINYHGIVGELDFESLLSVRVSKCLSVCIRCIEIAMQKLSVFVYRSNISNIWHLVGG